MNFQPKNEPGFSELLDSNSHRNMSGTMSISEIVSAMQASVDSFKEILLAIDAKHKAEIGSLQEKFELERLMGLQADEELKRARENYEALLKKVKKSVLRDDENDIEEFRNRNIELKRKRVNYSDSTNVVAILKNQVTELENEKCKLENANKNNLESIEKLRAEIIELRHKNMNNSVGENNEGEPQAPLPRNIDTGHSLDVSEMVDRGTSLERGRGQPKKVDTSSSRSRATPPTFSSFFTIATRSSGTPTPIAHTSATPSTTSPITTRTPTPIGLTEIASGQYPKGDELNCIRFDGKKGWKPPSRGSHRITEVIQTMYDAPYKSFIEVPQATRDMWWREWKKDYLIYPEEERLIREAFMYRCGKRMRGMYHEIRLGKGSHKWMNDAHLRVLREYWETEKFKVAQERAKANRASLKGGSLRTGGSTPIEGTRARMTRELQRPPTQSELFMKTHTKKTEKGRKWVDSCSERTYEAQLKYQTQVDSGKDPEPINEELIWLQTVAGPYKGRIYGTGHYDYTDNVSPASTNGYATRDDVLGTSNRRGKIGIAKSGKSGSDNHNRISGE